MGKGNPFSFPSREQVLTDFSVIQRQLWLMDHEGLEKNAAYDMARKEFYALRHEEEVERRVAKEEALWVGGYFGKGFLEVGMELEDQTYEGWKAWATKEMDALARQNAGAYTGESDEDAALAASEESPQSLASLV
jgi:small subunit ribosomal protein S23